MIELGAGVGLVGMACASLGSGKVTVTDLEEFLPALERTKAENSEIVKNRVSVEQLRFGNSEDIDKIVETGSHKKSLIVVGSDLVYFDSLFVPLAETIARLCHVHKAICYLAYKKRIWKNEKRFFSKILAQNSLVYEVVYEAVLEEEDGVTQATDGRVIQTEGDVWNTRIFKIFAAESNDHSIIEPSQTDQYESYDVSKLKELYPKEIIRKAPIVDTCEDKKKKKGKVPCNKEKKGRIR